MPLFNTLRDWRSAQSKREGVPPYVICTNRQFALMIKNRPQTLVALAQIDGFGKAKLERYGKEMLALLARTPATPQATDNGATPGISTSSGSQGGPGNAPTSA